MIAPVQPQDRYSQVTERRDLHEPAAASRQKSSGPVDWLGRHPSIALGVATAAGLALGWFVKRKWRVGS